MVKKPPVESLEAFENEGEPAPRLSAVEGSAGNDALAEFAAEEVPPPAVPPPERVVSAAPPGPVRTSPVPGTYRTRGRHRVPRVSRTSRTLFALAALATVAVVSVSTLNSLSKRAALDTPVPTDIVAADQLASRSMTPVVETVSASPVPSSTKLPAAPTPAAEIPGAETRRAAPPVSERRPAAARSATPPAGTPERVSEPRRTIDRPGPDRPPVQAGGPAPVPTRAVDTVPAPVPPATSTTGIRATESVQGPRLDPPPITVPGAPASTPAVAGPLTAPSAPASATVAAASAPSALSPSPVPAARVVTPTDLIEIVLGRYASAFSALDASRAKAVWPNVNERNLARAFESLEQQEFDLGACAITVTTPRAVATCRGTARYTPRVGNKRTRTESRQWTFRLENKGEIWSIASVESR